MSRRIILVSYDLKGDSRSYTDMYNTLKQAEGWWHHLESVWLLKSGLTASAWSRRLQPFVDEDDKLLVMEIEIMSAQGWLPEKAWDWLNRA